MSRPREQGGLFKHINGYWYWRRTNPKTGLREVRSTGMDRKDLAMRVAAKLDDEWEREVAGLQSYDWARRSLLELADEWLGEVKLKVEEKTGKQKVQLIGRALKDLNLRVVAELDDLAALDRRLKRLMKPARTLYRCYQLPLKQLSTWMAENNRYAERDLLANWKRIAHDRGSERRALLPDEVARAFAAADRLDAMHKRKAPLRPALVALLVTAPRIGSLVDRDVSDLKADRIDYGDDVGNKRRGYGALDAKTAQELRDYVGARKEGPLFLAADGGGYAKERFLDVWRQAFSLGTIDALLPDESEENRFLTSSALLAGRVKVSRGGSRLRDETRRRRAELETRILKLVGKVREKWSEAMVGVDVHAFRKTHQTWAEAQGIPAVLIDKQLGHAVGSKGLDVFKAVRALSSGSRTGRKHYLDLGSKLLDPAPCAEAVRSLLDAAVAELAAAPAPIVRIPIG